MKPKEELKQIKELLHDDLYAGSKDWKCGNTLDRIEWLISMYEGKKEEVDIWLENMGYLNDKLKETEAVLQQLLQNDPNL